MQKAKTTAKRKSDSVKRKTQLSAQQAIPYVSIHPDDACQLPGSIYTKTMEYDDINYSVASTEDQTAIFSGWSSLLNYFDSSFPFQLSFVNRRSRSGSKYRVNIPERHYAFDSIRSEFTAMLKNQIARSNNGIERAKYYNSTSLDCTHKFRDFIGSARALRRLSDQICMENALSVIATPKLHSQGQHAHYGVWAKVKRVGLIVDIQEKLAAGKGPAIQGAPHKVGNFVGEGGVTERASFSPSGGKKRAQSTTTWAKVYNLKQMASAMMFLQ